MESWELEADGLLEAQATDLRGIRHSHVGAFGGALRGNPAARVEQITIKFKSRA